MTVSAKEVKALRDRTGAGMLECKKALEDAGGPGHRGLTAADFDGVSDPKLRSWVKFWESDPDQSDDVDYVTDDLAGFISTILRGMSPG